jgi:hypothetical protein
MSSPDVWDDVSARVLAAAAALSPSIPVAMPNEEFERPDPPNYWIGLDTIAHTTTPIELTGGMWQESGTVLVHVMLPVFTGIRAGLVIRKAISNAFRNVADAPAGLIYRDGQMLDSLGIPSDDGIYRPLSLAVNYIWQDMPT